MRFGVFNRGLRRLPFLGAFLDGQAVKVLLGAPAKLDATVGWGRRKYARRARRVASTRGIPFVCLEDGFLRSFGTGEHFPPLSLVVDELGIYYDSTRPSALESLIASPVDLLDGIADDVARAKGLVLGQRLSKYNHAALWDLGDLRLPGPQTHPLPNPLPEGEGARPRTLPGPLLQAGVGAKTHPLPNPLSEGEGAKPARAGAALLPRPLAGEGRGEGAVQRVLVIDQTAGDMSVSLGGASAETFAAMLAAARTENPQATIYVKTHPEVTSGRKGGYLTAVQDDESTVVLRQAINPLSLIEQMDRVYVVTSTMGFEALLAGKPVTVFGMPWYAGWGATDDRQTCARRTRHRSVDELFAAAYFHYSRYLNPVTHQRGTIFDVIDWLVRQREMAVGLFRE